VWTSVLRRRSQVVVVSLLVGAGPVDALGCPLLVVGGQEPPLCTHSTGAESDCVRH
jgi:hypothetical protein